jgi:ABC-type phosphate transport system substrate-binding protein
MFHMDQVYLLSDGCAKFTSTVKPLDFSCIAPDPVTTIPIVHSENYEHDVVTEADALGSGTGIKQLCTQGAAGTAHIDFARSSRGPSGSDCHGLHFVGYARDGISLEANDWSATAGIHLMNNPDPLCTGKNFCLTQTQVHNIFVACTITNWNQVGGQNLAISIYTPQLGSGTRSTFDGFVGGSSDTCIPGGASNETHTGSCIENQNVCPNANSDQPAFIMPFSYAIYHTEINDAGGYRLASVDGIAPTTSPNGGSIGCLTGPPTCSIFPYSRYVYNVFCAVAPCGTAPQVNLKLNDYLNEEGWICKPSNVENPGWNGAGTPAVDSAAPQQSNLPHVNSLHFAGVNQGTLIHNKLVTRGFAPLGIDVIGSGDLASDHCRLLTT